MNFTERFLSDAGRVIEQLDRFQIDEMVQLFVRTREQGGRLFVLGVGGSAGNAGHAVNDFRKLAGIEAYSPTDNVSELTARINDESWDTVFSKWLEVSCLNRSDLVFVLSVGGGHVEMNVSVNLVRALEYANQVGSKICGIVGRNGGATAQFADACVVVPTVNTRLITPLSESFQAIIWHLIVSHPDIQLENTKW